MSEESVSQAPAVFSSKERAALVAKALSDAARRARFSTKKRRGPAAGGLRARRGERMMRFLTIATFIGIVLVPCLAVVAYVGFIETPQYEAEARFTVRGGLPPAMDSIGSLTGVPTVLIIQDTQVIMNYFQSRSMVESLDKKVQFQGLYQGEDIDWWSRLKHDQPIEKVLKYWKSHMSTSVQMPAGIVVFTVQAFTPDDAVKVADAALESGEQLVNQMNDQMKFDAVNLAETEQTRAMANVVKMRAALEKARNDEGMLSADATATGLTTLMETVQAEVLKMQQEFDSQRRYVRADAPQLRNLQTRIDAAQKEVDKIKAQMTATTPDVPRAKGQPSKTKVKPAPAIVSDPDDPVAAMSAGSEPSNDKVLSGSMSRLDYAKLENDIAEKIYAGSLAALEHARVASEMKLMYINTFVHPVAAEQAKYPRKIRDIALAVLAAFAAWGVVMTILKLTRNSFT